MKKLVFAALVALLAWAASAKADPFLFGFGGTDVTTTGDCVDLGDGSFVCE